MKLTEQQREILENALVEDWINTFHQDFRAVYSILEEVLLEGRIGFSNYIDDELIAACLEADLENALKEAGVVEEE